MQVTLSAQEFVAKWRKVTLKEKSAAQSHFNDLCRLVGHPTPVEADPAGKWFCFEAGATKQTGGEGWADVWKKDSFAWEYKGKHKDLDAAYAQLLLYRESLLNPPLLVVSDMETILIHTNFTNTAKKVVTLTYDDLLTPVGLKQLTSVFDQPESFRAPHTPEQVTKQAAADFARLTDILRKWGVKPQESAHFLIRLLFCLFAEDVGLLPNDLLKHLIQNTLGKTSAFVTQLKQLFGVMSTGGWFGTHQIPHFDGRLFDDDSVIPLDSDALSILQKVSDLDWSSIEPSISGTLFERSLDPDKRSQIGAHYTSKDDILLIVEPVLMLPLRLRWNQVKDEALAIAHQRDVSTDDAFREQCNFQLTVLLKGFASELADITVLDPACGSGNFLYVALKLLLDLEKEVITLANNLGLGLFLPSVSPAQLHGIEINKYAHELAQATIWIGYIQWIRDNGFGLPSEPILKPIDTVLHEDAILLNQAGKVSEPPWPKADYIIGNPPFLGGKLLRSRLGDKYVDSLFSVYDGRVPREADLVCYWFEKARAMVEAGEVKRVGLLATQSIRGGANRKVLERAKNIGSIFWAQSDREWIQDGVAVHVSMVGFDNGTEPSRFLDDKPVSSINADLTGALDLTKAQSLIENAGIAFMGDTKGGPFDIPQHLAVNMFSRPNPHGKGNTEVIRPWINGLDVTGRPRSMYIIDFGTDMSLEEASMYEAPFEYVKRHVKPQREKSKTTISEWWLHERPRVDMRDAVLGLERYIATPRVSKHRLFVWVSQSTLPDSATIVFAKDDDYFFGILHSKLHELWARATGTQLREAESGFRYTPTTTLETFPFPWPPGKEPKEDPRVKAIADASHELTGRRDGWLNPVGASNTELNERTLTNLYNQRPTWLEQLHRKLDDAVLDAYGWPHDLTDEQILEQLLALNLERSKAP